MSSTHQTLQCFLYSWQWVGILLCASIWVVKVDTKMQATIFLLHQHHDIAPHTLAGSDGTRFQHFLQMIPNLLNQYQWNWSKSFFKGSIISYFYYMFHGMGTANSAGSNKNTSWYSARSWQAASASSGVQESKPLKPNSLNNFPCLHLTVSLGVGESQGLSALLAIPHPQGVQAQAMQLLPWPLGFSFRGSASMLCYSVPPQLLFYCLFSTQCTCSIQ